jgi:hypothetical protein
MQHQCQIIIRPGPDGRPYIESAEGTLPDNAQITVDFAEDGRQARGHVIIINDIVIELEDTVPVAVPV